jgi:hypothetical protein
MEIKSETGYTEENVTDIDVWFASGKVRELTLHAADTYVDNAAGIDVEFATPKESLSMNKLHIEAYSIRFRTIKQPIKSALSSTKEA